MATTSSHRDPRAAAGGPLVIADLSAGVGASDDLRGALLALLDHEADPVLEFRGEVRVDSTGLAVLLAFFATAARERPGRRIVLTGVSPMLRRLLAMVRAHDFDLALEIHAAEEGR